MAEAQRVAGRPCAGAMVGPRARAPGSSLLMASQLRGPPQGSRPSRLWSKLRTAGGALVDTRRALSAGLSPATPAALHGAKATSPAQPRQGSGHLPVPMEGASPFMNRGKGLLGGGGPSEGAVELPSRSILPACCRNFSRSRDSRPNCSLCARHFSSSSRTRHCGRGARSQPAPGGGGARVRGSAPCPCVLRAMCACGLCACVVSAHVCIVGICVHVVVRVCALSCVCMCLVWGRRPPPSTWNSAG